MSVLQIYLPKQRAVQCDNSELQEITNASGKYTICRPIIFPFIKAINAVSRKGVAQVSLGFPIPNQTS